MLLLTLMSAQNSYSQKTITGTVSDENKMPIPGVSILKKGTTTGTTTDFDGNFTLSASTEDILIFSFLGYAAQNITVKEQTVINVVLAEDASQLEEIVVIGYGTAKKSDITGSVSQVTAKSFKDAPVVRVENALQGRASGITVSGGGQPGADIKVRVRGVNSVTGNNNPLVVVDGVFGGDLKSLNPDDISSMEVLKDASALAVYGSRGSNGVILVTTKKGKSDKTKFTVSQFASVSSFAKKIDKLNSGQFARVLNNEASDQNNLPFTTQQIANLDANPIDYEDLISQTGIGSNTQVSMSGRSDKINYFVSGNYLTQEGTQINTNYKRGSFRANLGIEVNDRLNIGFNVYGSREYTLNNQDAFARFNGSILLKALTWDPTSPVRDANGNYIYRTSNANNGYNPIYNLTESKDEVIGDRLNATLNLNYKINDNFTYTLITNATRYNGNTESFRWEKDPAQGVGSSFNILYYNNYKQTTHQISNILNWKKSFNKHNLDITGVYEFQGAVSKTNAYSAFDVNVPSFYHGDNSNNEFFTNGGARTSIQSYLGRVNYNFDNTIYLTGSLRVDESSKFLKGNRTGYFPSLAAAYSLNKLKFIEDGEFLSNLKLRAGWGQVGNENINALASSSITNDSGLYSFDGNTAQTGQTLIQIGNPDLTWETTTQINAGVDFGILQGRFTGSLDYYKKTTKDLLLQTTVTGTLYRKYENVGEVENKGLDISLSGDIIRNDNFNWNTSLNVSLLKNKVIALNGDLNQIPGNNLVIGGSQARVDVIKVGEPIGTFNGYTFLGTWKTNETALAATFDRVPGDPKYLRDENGEFVLGPIGNGLPTTSWGFNNSFTYKDWNFNIFITGATGFDVYNFVSAALNGGAAAFRDNLSPSRYNTWTAANETEIPRNGASNLLNSSRWIEDGSFIRLSNVKLGYNLKNLIKGVSKLEVYASGQNVFLITNYSGYDPEVSSTPITSDPGISAPVDGGAGLDQGAYPNPRTFTLGLKLEF